MAPHGAVPEHGYPDWKKFMAAPLATRMDMALRVYLRHGVGMPTSAWLRTFRWHCLHLAAFALLLRLLTPRRRRSEAQWTWWDAAYLKFNAWFYVLECLGLGMCYGMGGPGKATSWYFRFTPGTIKVPALPLPGVGHRRTVLDVALHLSGLAAALRLLLRPRPSHHDMRRIVVSELAAAVLDYSPMHHLFYNFMPMLGLAFPAERGGLAGAQLGVFGLYFFAGLSKRPAWAKHLSATFLAHSRWLVGRDWARRLVYRGDDDAALRPGAERLLGPVAAIVEAGGSLAMAVGDHIGLPALGRLGFLALLGMHGGIVTSVPLDVVTFNVYYVVSSAYLFRWRFRGLDAAGIRGMSPGLAAALALKAAYVAYGFARPLGVHYLQGWRVWAGNWTLPYLLVRRSARRKLARAVTKSCLPPPFPPSSPDYGTATGLAYVYAGNLIAKGLAACLGRALAGLTESEYDVVHLSSLQEWMMGQTWGDVNIMHAMRDWLVAECRLEEGDVRLLVVSALPWLGASAPWQLHDLRTGLLAQGSMAMGKLEQACARPSSALAVPGLLGEAAAKALA